MAYKFTETNKVNDEFTKVFGIGFKPFYDGLVSLATKQLWIDIVKFDEWLQKKHGNYEDEGKSMMDVIREHYGDKGVELVDALTGEDDEEGPKSELVEIEGVKTVAERTVDDYEVTYKPYKNYHKGLTVEQVVYDLMIIAAYDQLKMGQAVFKGDYTAAEMAGKVGYLHQFMEGEDYKTIGIKTETFCCSYHAGEAFAQMAEWEGVMSLAPKKYHRFAVEGKEMPSGVKLKPYTRCHGYKPRTISLAAENDRIAKKFEVIGPMYEVLGSEGMKRALSVLTAAKSIEKLYGYQMGELAERLLRRKLWREYGTCEPMKRRVEWLKSEAARMKQNGEEKSERAKKMNEEFKSLQQKIMLHMERYYTAKDFEAAPECWKVVDEDYAKELMAYFRKVLAESPVPKWPAKGDMVQMKEGYRAIKKWQGKLCVYEVRGQLDMYHDKINWYAVVCTTKGKHDSTTYKVDALEPWTEPEKPKKKQATGKPKATAKKTPAPNNSEVVTKQSASCLVTNEEPTLEERLRAALLRQLKQAA